MHTTPANRPIRIAERQMRQVPHQRRRKPEKVAKAKGSLTGKYLASLLEKRVVAAA